MSNNTMLVGAGAGIFGLLVGFFSGGPDTDDLEERLAARLDAAGSAGAEQVAALDKRIAGLEAMIAENAAKRAEADSALGGALEQAVKTLSDKADEVASSVTTSVNEATAAQTEQIESTLDGHMTELGGTVSEIVAAAPAAVAASEAPAAPAAVAAPAAPKVDGVRVGQTEVLLDGKARIFVSGIDADAGTARVAVNGLGLVELGGYKAVTFNAAGQNCTLNLDGIELGHVQMSATCAE